MRPSCSSLRVFLMVALALPISAVGAIATQTPATQNAVAQKVDGRKAEGDRLLQQGLEQAQTSQYKAAVRSFEQALVIYRIIPNRDGEANALGNLGSTYASLSQYDKAIIYYQQALPIFQQVEAHNQEALVLGALGRAYRSLSQYEQSITFYQQALLIYRAIQNYKGEAQTLVGLGTAHDALSKYEKAITFYQQALLIYKYRAIQDPGGEADILNNLGLTYQSLSQYEKAVIFYQQALAKDPDRRASTLTNLGSAYQALSQYDKAITLYREALRVFQQANNIDGEAATLGNLGSAYGALSQHEKAITFYRQALSILQKIKNRDGEAGVLMNLGNTYRSLSQADKAIFHYQQALSIFQQIKNRNGEAVALMNLGNTYRSLSQADKAITQYQKALPIFRQVKDRAGEGLLLTNLGNLFQRQQQPQLAIAFYKQSVNIRETIRQDLRILPRESQDSYTQSVADTYRTLADLLIQQGRLPEAQAVLELLKLSELKDFTRDAAIDSPGINIAEIEKTALQQILDQFTTLGNFSQKIAECEQTQCATLTTLEKQRDDLLDAVNQELNQQRAILAKHYATESATLTPDKLNAEARRIVNAQPGTVLIYPIVLKDKIQFLLALQAGNGAFTFRPVETKVSAEALFKQIQLFRDQLSQANPNGTPKTDLATVQKTSQQLYQWLIQPLEAELNNANVKHLVIAPDSTTRYIPFAALHNGKHYLIERYTVSTITAASKTDTQEKMPLPTGTQPLLLAMGASTFPSLPTLNNVPAELDAITRTNAPKDVQGIYPGREFLNTAFTYEALQASLKTGTYRILHLATHGAFKAGRPEDSYLVPGRGSNLTTALIDRLGNSGLSSIHLVVLSACETAVGDRASDGMEIPGISYFFLKNEVKSVLASLWSVNDASTALIMQQFYQQVYKNLPNGMTKATALRQVQRDFIDGKLTGKDAPRRADINVTLAPGVADRQARSANFTHPYYWAPFILIGNSL
jgi:CHAT domain-containing protein/tetratricopeptide (TPR) repeat protein